MPKSFSEAERDYIQNRLIEEVSTCLSLYGIRRTTVDEIVQRVGIPKGTFYLFYKSKDDLIFDAILKINSEIQGKLLEAIAHMDKTPDVDQLTELIFSLYQSLDGSFLLKLIQNGEMDFLLRKAPSEFIRLNVAEDDMMVGKLMAFFPKMDKQQTALYSGALRGIFLMPLFEKEIACEQFDDMLRMMIRGVVMQMFGE